MKEKIEFEVGDAIRIPSLDMSGYVEAIYIDRKGVSFLIEYLDGFKRVQREYFTPDRLQK